MKLLAGSGAGWTVEIVYYNYIIRSFRTYVDDRGMNVNITLSVLEELHISNKGSILTV